AAGLDHLAGRLEAFGLALEAEPEQVLLGLAEQVLELFVALLAQRGGLTHRGVLSSVVVWVEGLAEPPRPRWGPGMARPRAPKAERNRPASPPDAGRTAWKRPRAESP